MKNVQKTIKAVSLYVEISSYVVIYIMSSHIMQNCDVGISRAICTSSFIKIRNLYNRKTANISADETLLGLETVGHGTGFRGHNIVQH
jgi:hypothetical protein